MPECGPQPRPEDFTRPNGNVRWTAYNKAYKRWLLCVNPDVAEARAQATGAVLESVGELASDISSAYMSTQTGGIGADFAGMDFQQQQQPAPQSDLQKWALPAVAGLALLTFLRR